MRWYASPSSSIFSPASRSGAAPTFVIFWRAPGPTDLTGVEAEVGDRHLVDGLVLRRHDPLERGVAGLDHTRGHADHRGQRGLDLVEALLGLALDGDLAVTDLDVLGEGERRPPEHLGDLRRDGAGVPVGRLGGGDHQVDAAGPLDRLGDHLGRRQRVGAGERVVGDEHGPGRTHGQRGAQARDLAVGRHRDQDDLATAGLLGQLERHLDAVGVGVVEDELARAVEGVVAAEAAGDGRVRDLLHADCDVHSSAPCLVVVSACGRACPTSREPATPADDLILAAIGPAGAKRGYRRALDGHRSRRPHRRSRSRRDRGGTRGSPAGSRRPRRRQGDLPRDKTCGDGLTTGALRAAGRARVRRPDAARRGWASPTR